MGKIVVLDENTANQIAAGEVVERPSSVVKELIENSIDAGATNITVEIKHGGISYIKITDDGSGIEEDDVVISFERHATSKIRSADDLESIGTMGFRGEALASIASVSKVELSTRTINNQVGTKVLINGGKFEGVEGVGIPKGTSIIVRDLFFNTPARYKFLKKDSTEAGYITDSVNRIALAHPSISFKLINNNQIALQTPGNGDLQSVIFSIYGREVAHNLNKVDFKDDRIKITGFTGKAEISRANRNHQSIFLNGRWIKSKVIVAAVDEAYKTVVMKHKFPFLVLNIEINPSLVDVNVHPTKMEVRFSDEREIFRSVYHAIHSSMFSDAVVETKKNEWTIKENITYEKVEQQKILPIENKIEVKPQSEIEFKENTNTMKNVKRNYFTEPNVAITNKIPAMNVVGKVQNPETFTIKSLVNEENDVKSVNSDQGCLGRTNKICIHENLNGFSNQINTYNKEEEIILEDNEEVSKNETDDSLPSSELDDVIILGQTFSTYIIMQKDNELILMDQHAAHERVRFEELKEKYDKKVNLAQSLLIPVVIELSHNEIKRLMDYKALFGELGFEYEEFGHQAIAIRSVPYQVVEDTVKGVFLELFDYVQKSYKGSISLIKDEALYTIACKSAVKANKKLSKEEIEHLLEKLKKYKNPLTCPHGRPTTVRITKYELEKMFKRIV